MSVGNLVNVSMRNGRYGSIRNARNGELSGAPLPAITRRTVVSDGVNPLLFAGEAAFLDDAGWRW